MFEEMAGLPLPVSSSQGQFITHYNLVTSLPSSTRLDKQL